MKVAVVAGPDPGHAFPAIALCLRLLAAGDSPTLFTGQQWRDTARAAGVDAQLLAGLDPDEDDDDQDAGAKIHHRAARMAVLNLPALRALAPDLVCSDVITACGGMAAELLGELSRSRQTAMALQEIAGARWGVSEETRMAASNAAKRIGLRLAQPQGSATA